MGGVQHFLTEVWTEVVGGSQVYVVARKEVAHFQLDAGESDQTRNAVRFKVYEYVYVALGAEVVSQS